MYFPVVAYVWSGLELQGPVKFAPSWVIWMLESGSIVPSPQSTWTWYLFIPPTKFIEPMVPSRWIGFVNTVKGDRCPLTLSRVIVHTCAESPKVGGNPTAEMAMLSMKIDAKSALDRFIKIFEFLVIMFVSSSQSV